MTDMFVISRLDAKARTAVPKAVREALDLRPGDHIGYTIYDGQATLTAVRKPLPRENPFACFEEWTSEADTEGYASL